MVNRGIKIKREESNKLDSPQNLIEQNALLLQLSPEQQNELDRMRMEFTAQASQLENSLEIINKSEELYKQSILDKEELLNIAKVGYKSDRMSIEDYLKYEDDLLLEESNLYKIQAQKWETLMKLAVIYGNNIEEIVK